MPRSRAIKPGFFKNESLADLSPLTRLLFIGLWTLADRSGRLEYRPRKIKAEVFPFDNCRIEQMLDDLDKSKLILIYESDGEKYICIPTWEKHQHPHVKEPESTIPAPDEHRTSTVLDTCEHQSSTDSARVEHESKTSDSLLLTPDSRLLTPDKYFPSPSPSAPGDGECFDLKPDSKKPPEGDSTEFVEFWTIYPRKVRKAKARKALKAALKRTTWPKIKAALLRDLPKMLKDGDQYTPHPSTWLNGDPWDDEGFMPVIETTELPEKQPHCALCGDTGTRYEGETGADIHPVICTCGAGLAVAS